MGYTGTMIKKHLAMGLLVASLLVWALFSTFIALTNESETVLIGIDANGTRVISQTEDPLFKTEVVNFVRRFVSLAYNFDEVSFMDNVGSASELMTLELWNKKKHEINGLFELVKKEKISHSAVLQKIALKDGTYQVLIETNQMMRMANKKKLVLVQLQINKKERTPTNPWGMEIASLDEKAVKE